MDSVELSDDWKLRYAKYWLYIAAVALFLGVALLAKWWVTLTVVGIIILVLALNKYLFGKWWP